MSINPPILRKIIAFVTHPWGMVVTAIPIIFIYGYFSISHDEVKIASRTEATQQKVRATTIPDTAKAEPVADTKPEKLIIQDESLMAIDEEVPFDNFAEWEELPPLFEPSFYQDIFYRLNIEYDNWHKVYVEFGPPEGTIGMAWQLGFDENGNPHDDITYGHVAQRITRISEELPSPSPDLNLSYAETDLYLELYTYSIYLRSLSLYDHERENIYIREKQKVIQNLLTEYFNF